MALKGLDIFKLTPKTNCKDCGSPTCMAFSMKVAQGAVPITKCPHMSQDVIDQLSEATAPPMKDLFLLFDVFPLIQGYSITNRHKMLWFTVISQSEMPYACAGGSSSVCRSFCASSVGSALP